MQEDLPSELGPGTAADEVERLRANGMRRLPVRVVKAPLAEVLTSEDAVKIQVGRSSPDAAGIYVSVEFLDLPPA